MKRFWTWTLVLLWLGIMGFVSGYGVLLSVLNERFGLSLAFGALSGAILVFIFRLLYALDCEADEIFKRELQEELDAEEEF